jgi:hypothetical protein
VNGVTILDGELVANSTTTDRLLLVEITDAFGFGGISVLPLSQPIDAPDGMRALADDQALLLVDNGRLLRVTIRANAATVTVVRDGFNGPTAVVELAGAAYVVEGKLAYYFDTTLGDPGAFTAIRVALPAN